MTVKQYPGYFGIPDGLLNTLAEKIGEIIKVEEDEYGEVWRLTTHGDEEHGMDEEYLLFHDEDIAEKYAIKEVKASLERELDTALERISGSWVSVKIKNLIDDTALQEWAEEAICINGWEADVAVWDGESHDLPDGFIYCRV